MTLAFHTTEAADDILVFVVDFRAFAIFHAVYISVAAIRGQRRAFRFASAVASVVDAIITGLAYFDDLIAANGFTIAIGIGIAGGWAAIVTDFTAGLRDDFAADIALSWQAHQFDGGTRI
jgi:hypothetical protein